MSARWPWFNLLTRHGCGTDDVRRYSCCCCWWCWTARPAPPHDITRWDALISWPVTRRRLVNNTLDTDEQWSDGGSSSIGGRHHHRKEPRNAYGPGRRAAITLRTRRTVTRCPLRHGTGQSLPAVSGHGRLARQRVRRTGRQDRRVHADPHRAHRPAAQARMRQVQRHRQRISRLLRQHRRMPETARSAGRRPTKHGKRPHARASGHQRALAIETDDDDDDGRGCVSDLRTYVILRFPFGIFRLDYPSCFWTLAGCSLFYL